MRFGNNGFNERPQGNFGHTPVKEGGVYDVEVEAVGEKGDGICKVEGFVVFVPGVETGDNVKIKVNKVMRKVAFGEVVGESGKSEKKQEAQPAPVEKEDSEDFGEEPSEEEQSEEATSEEESSEEDQDTEEQSEEEKQ